MPLSRSTRAVLVCAVSIALALGNGSAMASAAAPASTATAVSTSTEPAAGTPAVSGSFLVGTIAVADPGAWEEGTTLTFRWFADSDVIPDASTSTLQLTDDLVGQAIRVEVTGTFADSSTQSALSALSPRVTRPGTVAATGTPVAGSTLTAGTFGWAEGTAFTYAWSSPAADLSGASGPSLTLADSLIGSTVTVTVTGSLTDHATASVTSQPVNIAARTLATAQPTISGTLAVGSILTAQPGAWTDGTALAYQWSVGGSLVTGATQPTFQLTSAHTGKAVSVSVTGSRSGYASATTTSDPTPLVVAAGTPTITGTAVVTGVLTAAPGTWATGTNFGYQWFADGAPIDGATGRAFTITVAQDGAALTVTVTGSKTSSATVARTSTATLRVMRWTRPTITGTLAYGSTLTARPNTWTAGSTMRYQWLADGKAITGATGSTLKLGSTLRDRRISVRVSGSKTGHPTATATSASTAKVLTAGVPTVSGIAVYGGRLAARTGTWSSSTTLRYAWLADGAVISGATSSTLTLTSATRGKRIAVRVTGSKSGYATVARTSTATARVSTAPVPTIAGTRLVTYTLSARPGPWTTGTTFAYRWYANGVAISGATSSSLRLSSGLVGKRITLRVTGTKSGYATVARTSGATAVIAYPSRTAPVSGTWNCPSWAPIKGNADSMIYHLPSGQYYSRTNPEECFRTEAAAVNAGYRKSQR